MSDNLSANTKSIHEIQRNNDRLKNFNEDFLKCEFCKKSFTQAGSLRRHIKTIHKGHKDFKCDTCRKSFTQASILRTHIKTIHEGCKDFKCDTCGKLFAQAG